MRIAQGDWQRVSSLDRWLRAVPGYADVWADDDGVTAVLSSPQQITVARLRYDAEAGTYQPHGSPTVWKHGEPAARKPTECATIARDQEGHWWIAYDAGGVVWVRTSRDVEARQWESPVAISEPLQGDDISAIFPLLDGVGVVWTDQSRDAIYFRRHAHRERYDAWQPAETVAQGGGVANNHLHAAAARDGTVYVASKRNRYEVGQPLLVLRVRHAGGRWQSAPLAIYTAATTPTRPIALLQPDEQYLRIVYTALDNSMWNQHSIVSLAIGRSDLAIAASSQPVISAHLDLQSATSCKRYLPGGPPWIVLASDRWGNIFEGVLPATAR